MKPTSDILKITAVAAVSSAAAILLCAVWQTNVTLPAQRDRFEVEAVNTGYAQFNPKTRAFEWKKPDLLADELLITSPKAASLIPEGPLPSRVAKANNQNQKSQ